METGTSNYNNAGPVVNIDEGNPNITTHIIHYHSTTPATIEPHTEPKGLSFNIEKPVNNFCGRLKELQILKEYIHLPDKKRNVTVVSGLGGIGKTQLVRRYIVENESFHQNFVWIDAESSVVIFDSIKALAEDSLNIPITYTDGTKKDLPLIIERVVKHLSKEKTLLVYDNVKNIQDVKFLCSKLPIGDKFHGIITSRILEWGNEYNVIKLMVWETADAIEYLSKALYDTIDSYHDKVLLVQEMQAFPLALTQATAFFINDHWVNDSFNLNEYLSNRGTAEIISSQLFLKAPGNLYDKTTYTVWDCTIDQIEHNEPNGCLAAQILNIIAYFGAEDIHSDIFIYMNPEKVLAKESVKRAFRLLINYSMVDKHTFIGVLSVHRLVQETTKLKLKSSHKEKQILQDGLWLISKLIEVEHVNLPETYSHALYVFEYAFKFDDLKKKYKTLLDQLDRWKPKATGSKDVVEDKTSCEVMLPRCSSYQEEHLCVVAQNEMDQKVFVENVVDFLPNIEGGPTGIGNLWDCHASQAVGQNLFGNKLTSDHLDVDTIKDHIECLEKVENVDQAIKWFLQVYAKNEIPDKFQEVLSTSLNDNSEFRKAFDDAGALFYWNDDKKLFEQIWSIETVKKACEKLFEMIKRNNGTFENVTYDFNIPVYQDELTETDDVKAIYPKFVSIKNSMGFNNSYSEQKTGWASEIDETISKLLKDLKVNENLSDSERSKHVDTVWKKLLQMVSNQLRVEPVERVILNEIKGSYYSWPEIESIVAKWLKDESSPNLKEIKALDKAFFQKKTLDLEKCKLLESNLDKIPETMLQEFKTDKFLGGMVAILNTKVNSVIQEFMRKFLCTLDKHFLREVHVYAILEFIRVMKFKEAYREEYYHPYKILLRNEKEYRAKITMRLIHGFGYKTEGVIIGKNLLTVIKKLGQNQGNKYHTQTVRSLSWLINTENIRLQYFSELAQQVNNNESTNALQHFSYPKDSINSWFKQKVNLVPQTAGKEKYTSTTNSDRVFQDIRDLKDCSSIKKYVTDYVTKADDGQYHSQENLDYQNDLYFKMLQEAILNELKHSKNTIQSVILDNPSNNPEITDLLGCTESCHFCGSLCWGEAGHSENTDYTKKHYYPHQPKGLCGTSDKTERYLLTSTCGATEDSCLMFWGKYKDEGMTWSQTKQHEDFVNWIFRAHYKTEFNDLMKWFFVKLHKEIAENRGLLPALQEHLQNFGTLCSLDHILRTIETRI